MRCSGQTGCVPAISRGRMILDADRELCSGRLCCEAAKNFLCGKLFSFIGGVILRIA